MCLTSKSSDLNFLLFYLVSKLKKKKLNIHKKKKTHTHVA